jgi:hypothetical protein
MIIDIIQTQRLPKSHHQVLHNGNIIAEFNIESLLKGLLSISGNTYNISAKNLSTVTINKDGYDFGAIKSVFQMTKKVLFFKTGYDYYNIILNGEIYNLYEVGLGENQHYYCIYKDNATVAIINKFDRIINDLDKYRCYILEDAFLLPTLLFCLFLESGAYYDIGAIGNSDNLDVFVTVQEELNSKYDPTFIPKIKEMDGISD